MYANVFTKYSHIRGKENEVPSRIVKDVVVVQSNSEWKYSL
jgi:hypothetical protein